MSESGHGSNGTAWKILGAIGGVLVLLGGFVLHSLEDRLSELERSAVRKDGITMAPQTRSELDAHQRRLDTLENHVFRGGRP